MPQAAEAITTTADRDARASVARGEGCEAAGAAELLSTKDLLKIGQTIGGRAHWQADCAREIGHSKSSMTRYLNKSRPISPLLAKLMRRLILAKIDQLAKLLTIVGLPGHDHPHTKNVQSMISEALELAKAISPTKDPGR